VIDAETCARERVDPIVFEQAADDQPEQEIRQIAGSHRMRVEAQRHSRRIPVDDHADEREERDATEFRQTKLGKRPAVLRGEIGQIVRELVEPVHAGTRGRQRLRQ
jgi:hypothetical protein